MKNIILLSFLFLTFNINAQSTNSKYEKVATSLSEVSLVDYAIYQEKRFRNRGRKRLSKGRLLAVAGIALSALGAAGLSEKDNQEVAIGALSLGGIAFTVGLANITIGKSDYKESKRILKEGFTF